MSRPKTASGVPPTWSAWDGPTYGQHFHGRELTVWSMQSNVHHEATTYRNDYPRPPLFWKHVERPDHSNRPAADFNHSTSHRDDFKAHRLAGLQPERKPYPEQKYHPKLQATTTSRESFLRTSLPPPRAKTPQVAHSTLDLPMGTTTMRDDYRQWTFPERHTKAETHAPKPTKFHGTTTTRSDFPWPKSLQPPPSMYKTNREPREVPDFDGDTTYRQAYSRVQLPRGMAADIGLQVANKPYAKGGVGGQFEPMIDVRKSAPQIVSKTFTTAQDGQPAVAIVVVAKRPEYPHGVILGTFTMDGIRSAPTGVPKIEVTLKLLNEKTLHASALYRNGKRTKALTFRAAKQAPNLRAVATADDIPEDDY